MIIFERDRGRGSADLGHGIVAIGSDKARLRLSHLPGKPCRHSFSFAEASKLNGFHPSSTRSLKTWNFAFP